MCLRWQWQCSCSPEESQKNALEDTKKSDKFNSGFFSLPLVPLKDCYGSLMSLFLKTNFFGVVVSCVSGTYNDWWQDETIILKNAHQAQSYGEGCYGYAANKQYIQQSLHQAS